MILHVSSRTARRIGIFFVGFTVLSFGWENAIAAIQEPERLTLPFVVDAARRSAAVYRSADALSLSLDASLLQARAPLAPKLSLGLRKFDDRYEPSNAFAPYRNQSTTYFGRYDQGIGWTGTQFSFELQHSNTTLGFPGSVPAPYFETRYLLSARQSILQSLIYGADRKRILGGETGAEAARLSQEDALDQATLEVIQAFYAAWLAQADVRSAESNLKNRNDLFEITRVKVKRGTAERPDLLQSEAGVKAAQTRREEAVRVLGDIWRDLVVSLGLPEKYLAIDPVKIPVDLDQPIQRALERCERYSKEGGVGQSLSAKLAALNAASAEATAASLKAQDGIDLVVTGSYGANTIDPTSRPETWSGAFSRDFPAWTLEIAAQLPLGPSAVAGDARLAATNAIRARAVADQERDIETVRATNRCLELRQKEAAYARAKETFELQVERLRLEEGRFRIGRSTLTQVVIASDDRVIAERSLQQSEVDRRLASWQVLALEGGISRKAATP